MLSTWPMNRVEHTLPPVYDSNCRVLILGSMPSEKSRNLAKYYGHPQNRFWPVLSIVYGEEIGDWKKFALSHHIALWDVIESCDIEASSDSSIKNVRTNDIKKLISGTKITHIYTTGRKAYELYKKHIEPSIGIKATYLSSPSPANATKKIRDLALEYKKIKEVTDE